MLCLLSLFIVSSCQAQNRQSDKDNPVDKYAEEAYLELMKPGGSAYKALDICKKGIKKDSTYAKLWEYKGQIEYDIKDFKNALYSLNKALDLDPENLSIYFSIGRCQRMLMQFDDARTSLNLSLIHI